MKHRATPESILISTWADILRALLQFSLPYAQSEHVLNGLATIEQEKDGTFVLKLTCVLNTEKSLLYKRLADRIAAGKHLI